MGNASGLKCRQCGRLFDAGPLYMCEFCFGPLEVEYNYERVARQLTRKRVKKGPRSIWRYRELLPVDMDSPVELGAGYTPLLQTDRLARAVGLRTLFVKYEGANPTFSCKDRNVAVAVSKALEFGFKTLACASAGNLAVSLAAHSARAGLRCVIFLPHGSDTSVISSASVYGADIVTVKGAPADVNRLCAEAAMQVNWAFVNIHLRPFYAEGAKTIAYEICEQLEWSSPHNVIMPMASGSTLTGIYRGFNELRKIGLLKGIDAKMIGVQPEGCSPITKAFEGSTSVILPAKPDTYVKSLSVGTPADGTYALEAIRESEGCAVSVSDDEITEGVKLLARTEGIYAEPSGGAAVAALRKLVAKKKIRVGEQVVLVIAAKGLPSAEYAESISSQPYQIEPTRDAMNMIIARIEADTKQRDGASSGDAPAADAEPVA